jgi:copper homeostasis protein CutC
VHILGVQSASAGLEEGCQRGLVLCPGHPELYTGEAINPANLSWFEDMLGIGKVHQSQAVLEAKQEEAPANMVAKAGLPVGAASA